MGINSQPSDFREWLFTEIEIKDISHLNKKYDMHYMTAPVFKVWWDKELSEK